MERLLEDPDNDRSYIGQIVGDQNEMAYSSIKPDDYGQVPDFDPNITDSVEFTSDSLARMRQAFLTEYYSGLEV